MTFFYKDITEEEIGEALSKIDKIDGKAWSVKGNSDYCLSIFIKYRRQDWRTSADNKEGAVRDVAYQVAQESIPVY